MNKAPPLLHTPTLDTTLQKRQTNAPKGVPIVGLPRTRPRSTRNNRILLLRRAAWREVLLQFCFFVFGLARLGDSVLRVPQGCIYVNQPFYDWGHLSCLLTGSWRGQTGLRD